MYRELGKVNPYGVYDQTANVGWVSVGTDHDTAEFAVESIRRWWSKMGSACYPQATDLLITADGGGSNRNLMCDRYLVNALEGSPRAHRRYIAHRIH